MFRIIYTLQVQQMCFFFLRIHKTHTNRLTDTHTRSHTHTDTHTVMWLTGFNSFKTEQVQFSKTTFKTRVDKRREADSLSSNVFHSASEKRHLKITGKQHGNKKFRIKLGDAQHSQTSRSSFWLSVKLSMESRGLHLGWSVLSCHDNTALRCHTSKTNCSWRVLLLKTLEGCVRWLKAQVDCFHPLETTWRMFTCTLTTHCSLKWSSVDENK